MSNNRFFVDHLTSSISAWDGKDDHLTASTLESCRILVPTVTVDLVLMRRRKSGGVFNTHFLGIMPSKGVAKGEWVIPRRVLGHGGCPTEACIALAKEKLGVKIVAPDLRTMTSVVYPSGEHMLHMVYTELVPQLTKIHTSPEIKKIQWFDYPGSHFRRPFTTMLHRVGFFNP
jgi:ADP-ribose pyrophosphatase YjhB (NUDIX family)